MINYEDDGTITATFDVLSEPDENGRRTVIGTESITTRRPVLDDLFDLWEAYDRLAKETQRNADAARDADGDAEPENPVATARRTMEANARWYRNAFDRLGDKPLDGLPDPAWFGGAATAVDMLRHWQDVPLAPGGPARPTVPPAPTP